MAALPDNRLFLSRQQPAQIAYVKFLQEHPAAAEAHLACAELLSENGNLRAAVAHWHTAQQLEPGNAAIANSLG
jgi:Flp pilus assembly protein TadD